MASKVNKTIIRFLNIFQLDLLALGIIYFLPELTRSVEYPLYYLEPLRLMMLMVLAHTGILNSAIPAAFLPWLGYFTGGHPHEVKTVLIMIELLANVGIFYKLVGKLDTILAMPLAIIASKLIYYALKWILIQTAIIEPPLISTPWIYQIIVMVVMSVYVAIYYKK